MTDSSDHRPSIYVDADACPVMVKTIVYRTSQRRELNTIVVANQSIAVPQSPWIRQITVRDGPDQADHAIVQMVNEGDVVVADDIPLAARVVEKGAVVISSRGDRLDEKNIHSRLASRDLMEQLRSAGMETAGPRPFSQKDSQAFANQLDRTLTKLMKPSRSS